MKWSPTENEIFKLLNKNNPTKNSWSKNLDNFFIAVILFEIRTKTIEIKSFKINTANITFIFDIKDPLYEIAWTFNGTGVVD